MNAISQPPADDQGPDEIIQVEDQPARRAGGGVAGWMISGAVHAGAIMLAMVAVFGAAHVAEKDVPPLRTNPLAPPEKPPEKPKERRELQEKPQIDAVTESDTPSPATLQTPSEVAESEADTDTPDTQGRPDAMASSETGGPSTFMAMGAGSSGSGIYGNRTRGGRKHGVLVNGGSPGSEAAVDASLRWLKRHQSVNGSWEADTYFQNCTAGAKCEPGRIEGGTGCNAAMTGYALLCFLGAGYQHKLPTLYRSTVKHGLENLLAMQTNDGLIGLRNYEHPIATMALVEAYAMTGDPELRGPAQKAVNQILARQNQDKAPGADGYVGGLGWDYIKATNRNDSSVTGWNIMALKSAVAAGLDTGKGMDGAKKWVELHWQASNPKGAAGDKPWQEITAYDQSHFDYCWTTGQPIEKANNGRESIGLVCAVFLNHQSGDALLESLANTVMAKQVPKAYPTNAYYLYYNTMGMFQVGGPRWDVWNGSVRDLLVNAQRKSDDCLDGSWDPNGTGVSQMSRVLSTVYCALSLEVYYRYDQIKKLHHKI